MTFAEPAQGRAIGTAAYSSPARWSLLFGSLAALSVSLFVFVPPNYAQTTPMTTAETIRPFTFKAPQAQLDDLRRRIAATQWPEKETVSDDSQGVPLAMMQELARYWATDYDWRKAEAQLTARTGRHVHQRGASRRAQK